MIQAYKIRLHPNNKQRTLLEQSASLSRWAYNWALEQKKSYYEEHKKNIPQADVRKLLTQLKKTEEYQWLFHYSNNITKQAIKDCDVAFQRFFKGQSKFPKFKSKRKSKWSFYNDNSKVKLNDTHIRLEKIGWVRLAEKGYLPHEYKPLSYRISREGLHWYVSSTVEMDDVVDYSPSINEPIGIDVGIKTLAMLSNGKVYKNINKGYKSKKIEKRLRRLQRKVSRKYHMNKEGSRYRKTRNIIKIEKEITKLRTRLNHIRKDYLHQMTSEIVRTKPSHIVIEDLNVKGMMKNKHLADHVAKCNFHEIERQFAYKCEKYNVKVVIADRWYPSSKTCSNCGEVNKELKLSDRVFKCSCGHKMDRDVNASVNLSKLVC